VSLKIDSAAHAGAIAVLIGLVAPGDAVTFSQGGGSDFVPTLVITQATSNLIKSALTSSAVNATISPNNAICLLAHWDGRAVSRFGPAGARLRLCLD
jgi:hypothetical protein